MLPPGTTWLDLFTLGIAVVGLWLTFRRDRRDSAVRIRLDVFVVPGEMFGGSDLVAIGLTNIARRPATASAVALFVSRDEDAKRFESWYDINPRTGPHGFPASDPALPRMLEPGSPTYPVKASASGIKSALFPELPAWAMCEDSLGHRFWARVPEDVRAAIREATRIVSGPEDEYGQPTRIEIDDDGNPVAPEDAAEPL